MDEYDSRPDPRLQVSICEEDGFYNLRVGENGFKYLALVLIFNQIDFQDNAERRCEEPGIELQETMNECGFKVFYFKNYTRTQIMNTIGKYATLRRRDRKEYASLLVFFLSHGNIKTVDNDFHEILKTADDDMLISDLWKNFESTETWNNKPKCFFFQTCRGDDLVEGVKVLTTRSTPNSYRPIDGHQEVQASYEGPSKGDWLEKITKLATEFNSYDFDVPNTQRYRENPFVPQETHYGHSHATHTPPIPFTEPKFSDLLIFHSTYQGAASFREHGYSPFINAVNSNFRKDIFEIDLFSIAQNIQKQLAYTYCASDEARRDATPYTSSELEGSRQMPLIESTLTGKLRYEKPGNIDVAAGFASQELPKHYDMKSGKGRAVIFANKYNLMNSIPPMPYVDADVKGLVQSFERLNCDVTVHWDLVATDFVNTLSALGSQDYSEHDFFCLVFYGYGFKDKIILKYEGNDIEDYRCVEVSELWQPFLGSRCQTLIDKPKFFIVSAIGLNQPGVSGKFKRFVTKDVNIENTRALNDEAKSNPAMYVIPEAADFLLLFHTASGTANYMDFVDDFMEYDEIEEPSSFFKILNEELQNMRNFVGDRHLLHLIQRIQYKVTNLIQENVRSTREGRNKREVPLILSTLTKKFTLQINQSSE